MLFPDQGRQLNFTRTRVKFFCVHSRKTLCLYGFPGFTMFHRVRFSDGYGGVKKPLFLGEKTPFYALSVKILSTTYVIFRPRKTPEKGLVQ